MVVAGRDGAGTVQIYFPDGPRAELLPAGEDVPLAFGVELDGVLGRETFYGVFCDGPVEVDRVRAHLFAGAAAPPGCAVDSLALEKRAPAWKCR